jgi:GNAT superfamily N-acetyltransferase
MCAAEHTLHQIGGERGRFCRSPARSGWVWAVCTRSSLAGESGVRRLEQGFAKSSQIQQVGCQGLDRVVNCSWKGNNLEMQIRRAATTDEEVLVEIRREAILALAVPILAEEEAEAWAMQVPEDRIGRALREHEVWVAEDKMVIGWVEIDQDRIAGLYVSPDYASRGVGSTLLVFAESSISRCGHRVVQLEASRNALNFYLRRGYVQWGLPNSEEAYPLYKELSAREPVCQVVASIQTCE